MAESTETVTLVIEGTASTTPAQAISKDLQAIIGTPRILVAYKLKTPVRDESEPKYPTIEANDNDLIELQLEGGDKLLMTVADYRAQFGDKASRGLGDAGKVRIKATLQGRSRDRGIIQWIVKGLKVIGIDLVEMAAEKLADYIDTKKGLNGLYTCLISSDFFKLTPVPNFPPGNDPLLLFIHGTMSSTEGSFGGIWTDQVDVRKRLNQQYPNRCYAFEHKTFTESPITNALALVNALPDGARLHLVSHSRGGMIGELLCRASRINKIGELLPSFEEIDFSLFSDSKQRISLNDLRQLASVLNKKQLRVERFVRVACPARGTTMSSGRLDRFLSVLNMGLSSLITLDWVSDIAWFVAAVAKERTDPTVMPGLEAMMPGSATVSLLNRPGVQLDSDLRVIAGDYDGGGVLETVADWALEGFYGCENDIVVNTPSMYGGAVRMDKKQEPCGWFYYTQGAQVYHFSYFKQSDTANKLANALLQDDARNAGFQPLALAPHKDDPIARGIALDMISEGFGDPLEQKPPSKGGNLPILILVPGIMGTHLKVGSKRIWLDFSEFAGGQFSRLTEDAPGVVTDGVVKMSYKKLGDHLSSSHEVLYFPYDWRRSLREKGKEFAAYMYGVLNDAKTNNRPVRILAHSMGGLLVRMAAVLSSGKREGNDWWERFRAVTGNRLLMAGTPTNGSWTVPYVLTGRDSIIGMLKTIDLHHNEREILKIVSGFEGFLEMLPKPGEVDCFNPDSWSGWQNADGGNWPVPDKAALAKCMVNRELLDEFDFDREKDVVRYVAGCADSTPSGVSISNGKLVFNSSPLGDGRVLWETGIPAGVKRWYVTAKHGDLLNYDKAFKGLAEIISVGETTLLPATPPADRAESAKAGVMADVMIPYYPDEAMLRAAALGGELIPLRRRGLQTVAKRFRVTVCHGDLAAAKYPVAVGHYVGDSINGSEAVLDRRLNGLLSRRHKLGIYPGPEGTCEVFIQESNGKMITAIVLGLGQVGDLTPDLLTSGFARALLEFATTPTARKKITEKQEGFAVSTILIGSGAGWGLGVRDSVRALIEGACRANSMLSDLDGDPVYLTELEFLEVYEDRSLQALRAVREFAALGVLGDIDYDIMLRPGVGGRCRAMCENGGDWWQRIKVEINDDDEMKFTTLTGLARIEERIQPTQRALVDRLVEQAVTQSTIPMDAMIAIYNLITPNAIKERAPDQGNTLMMLDEQAAGYPWEMMHIGDHGKKIPLALRSGLIRQLALKEFRHRPARTYQLRALVIADPLLPTGCDLPQLPGAKQEGSTVASILAKGGYTVKSQISSEPIKIVSDLFADDYRILHLAGHGIYKHPITRKQSNCPAIDRFQPECEKKTKYVTGMVLDWPQPGAPQYKEPVFLTAVEVEQMTVVPELVFINCCFLGKMEKSGENRNLFAASLAAQFIKMGVRAVVAAGWAVDDTAANAFAEKFYTCMLENCSFGESVTAARRAAKDATGEDKNTWAAYQCYGDPAYRLNGSGSTPSGKFFLSPREVLCDLWAIRDKKHNDVGDRLNNDELRQELEQMARLIPHEWMVGNGDVRNALGAAYAALGLFDSAISHYQAAAQCNDGSCDLKAMEEWSNLEIRNAFRLYTLKEKNGAEACKEIVEQIKSFKSFVDVAKPNKQRCCLMGSAYKRLAMIQQDLRRKPVDALCKLAFWYDGGMQLDPSDPYPALNWSMAKLALHYCGKNADFEILKSTVAQARLNSMLMFEQNPKFWLGIHSIDADFFLLMLDEKSNEEKLVETDEIIKRYKEQFARYGTGNFIDSAKSQFDFYLRFITDRDIRVILERVKEGLAEV
jgi:pimeloyl-ACP methyl ester carboxylesterase/tetratricopeptide (TPR) repeat protein